MHPFFQRPGVRRCRIIFRWCRISVWLVVFFAVAAVSYLHLIGLPDFLKRPMLRSLLAEGIVAQFSNMQLGWGRGPLIAVENASFSRSDQALSPRLSASEAELTLNWNALLHFHIDLSSLQVSGAQLQLPVSETNGDSLSLNHVALDMRFYSNDVMRLNNFRGVFNGIQLDIIGAVSHASAMRHWKFRSSGANTNGAFQARLRQVAQIVQKIHLTGTPVLEIETGADGEDMNSFHAEMNFAAPAAHTPWGDVTNLIMDAACARLRDSGKLPFLQVQWSAQNLTTRWAAGHHISFSTIFSRDANSNFNTEIRFNAIRVNAALDSAGSNWFRAGDLSWNGSTTLASSNFIPLQTAGKLHAIEPQTPWGSAHELSLECRAARAPGLPAPEAGWGPWTIITPWTLDWQADLRNVSSPKLRLNHLAFSGHWRAPQVVIENLQGELYNGQINAGAILDISSRELHCNGVTDLKPSSISQLFKPTARNWLAQFDWTATPKVNAQLRVVLPPWTNRTADWSSNMGSSLQLAGDFTVGSAAFLHIPVSSAASHVTYTNHVWNISHLHAVRPDGDIDMDYNAGPQGYSYLIDSRLDPKDALPLLGARQRHVLDGFAFKQSPEIHAEIWGCWNDPRCTGFAATVRATNFMARGEPVSDFSVRLGYTNFVLSVHNLYLSNNQCQARAPWLQADFGTKMVRLTNAAGTLDPALLQRILGKNSPDFLNVIHFDAPPSVSVAGSFSLTNPLAMDLHFLVNGQGLHYTNLVADRITGAVDWTGHIVTLTNISASLYHNGSFLGWIEFDSRPKQGSYFRADVSVRNIDMSPLVVGITGKTNQVEGRLDGNLALSGLNSSDKNDWHGQGSVYVHDALPWDIKLFGLLSPVLNIMSPGWGYSRAQEASATFVITNNAVATDNLEVRFTGFRLNLRGTVDMHKKINARLEANPAILTLAFAPLSKLFEYHISGTLRDPIMEPVFVPKFVLFLLHPILHPFHTLKTIAIPDHPRQTTPPAPASNDTK